MNYPLISEYIEAIKAADENFAQLKHLRPVLDDDGQPVMTSGNFAVVFKMKDEQTGKFHAVKCFVKEQGGRSEAYHLIAEELEYVNSTFLTPIKYLDKELFVDTSASDETEFPVLLMDWVEGKTLDKYIREHIDNQYVLSLLAYQFSRLAMWLMPQPFAHGDLKPDNILVREDGTLVLVDYDGMYVPSMKGQIARELGSHDFRHPDRTENSFDEHIDDLALVSILLSLKAIALQPSLLEEYGASDRLLFSAKDYRDLSMCEVLKKLYPSCDSELNILMSLFIIAIEKKNLSNVSFRLLNLSRPKEQVMTEEEIEARFRAWEEEMAPFDIAESWPLDSFIKEFKIISFQQGFPYCSVTDGGEDGYFFKSKNGKEITVFNHGGLTKENILTQKDSITVELRKSGHYILCGYGTKASDEDFRHAWKDEQGVMYSEDHIKLIGVYGSYLPEYEIAEGTEVICDDALNGFWSEIEGLMISGKITIPSSVRYIGRNPFRGDYDTIICKSPHFVVENGALYTSNKKRLISCFSKDSEFVIPDGVEQIGSFAFYNCDISRIFIPESVSYIGDNPFIVMNLINENPLEVICNSHRFLVKGNAIYQKKPQRLISYWGKSQQLYIEDGTIIVNPFSFYNGVRLIYLPQSVKIIHEEAFCGYFQDPQKVLVPMNSIEKFTQLIPQYKEKIVEVDLSKEWFDEFGVKYSADRKKIIKVPYNIDTEEYHVKDGTEVICEEAFMWCEIKKVTLPPTIKEIGDVAFFGCKYLNSILISGSLDKIGNNPFANCPSLNTIDCQTDNLVFENGVLFSSDRKHLISYCRKDYEFTIPDSVEYIGNRAFLGCNQLVSVIIQNSVTKIGDYSFCACRNLKHIIIPDSIKEIGACAFRDCVSLEDTIIPDSVVKIGNGVFAECKALKKVFVKDYVKEVDGSLFLGCNNLSRIIVHNGQKEKFENNNFGGIIVVEEQEIEKYHEDVTDEDLRDAWIDDYGAIYSSDRERLLKGPNIPSYTVIDGTYVICENAFSLYESLTEIVIPNSVIQIGKNAFWCCKNLKSVKIPQSVKIIKKDTFRYCLSLTNVEIPSSVKKIESGAFEDCPNIINLSLPKDAEVDSTVIF